MESISDKFFRLGNRSKINEQAAPNSYYVSLLESVLSQITESDSRSDFYDDPTQYPRTINDPNERPMTPDLAKRIANTEARFKAQEAGRQNNPRPVLTKLKRIGKVAVGRAARKLGLRPSR